MSESERVAVASERRSVPFAGGAPSSDGARLGEADETLDAYRSRRSDLASSWWIERIERGDEAASNEIMSLEGKGHAHAAGT